MIHTTIHYLLLVLGMLIVHSCAHADQEASLTQTSTLLVHSDDGGHQPSKSLYHLPKTESEEPPLRKELIISNDPQPTSIAPHTMAPWLVGSSIKNAPPLFQGICTYLKSRTPKTTIPSFHRFILVGPPGTGKTTLAQALGFFLDYDDVVLVPATTFLGKYRNETAVKMRDYLEQFYIDSSKKIIIIIDELHKLFENHKDGKTDDAQNAAAFWLVLDTLAKRNPNVVVIGTANNIKKLPPEIKSRFHGKMITMPLPDKKQTLQAFKDILRHDHSIELDRSINDAFLGSLVKRLQDSSLRDVQLVIDTAKIFYYADHTSETTSQIKLNRAHFEQAVEQLNKETKDVKETLLDRFYPSLKKYSLVVSLTLNMCMLSQLGHAFLINRGWELYKKFCQKSHSNQKFKA